MRTYSNLYYVRINKIIHCTTGYDDIQKQNLLITQMQVTEEFSSLFSIPKHRKKNQKNRGKRKYA